MTPITTAVLAGVIGLAAGFILRIVLSAKSQEDLEAKKKEILLNAKEEALKLKEEVKKDENNRRKDLERIENSLRDREASLEKRSEKIEADKSYLDKQSEEIEEIKKETEKIRQDQQKELEKVAKLSKKEALDNLLVQVEKDYSDDIIRKIRSMKETMKKQWDAEAKEIIATTIERLATDQTAESTIMTVHLPNEEIKGKIIGKEGRNIQAFEKATGVDLVIDETPETVTVSSFDPVRRAVASKALQALIKDGRIQPAKIEELVKKAQESIKMAIESLNKVVVALAKAMGIRLGPPNQVPGQTGVATATPGNI